MHKELYSLILLALISSGSVYAAGYASQDLESNPYSSNTDTYNNSSLNQTVLSGRVVSIAAGTSVGGTIDRGLSSNSTRVGERGFLTLNQASNGIPVGSRVEFTVSRVSPAKRGFDNPGELQLKAIRVIYPNGSSANLTGEAYIVEDNSSTILSGNTKGKRVAAAAGKTAAGAGIGALGGLIGSRIGSRNRSTGRSVALGSAIGAGIGLAGAGISKGRDVEVNSGDKLFLKFNRITQVNVPN
jgi:hypothetical protein